ncbi:MAG: cation transporter [Bacteroidales bacterium]|nr:cation transporter [Bacteroidales bacterium]
MKAKMNIIMIVVLSTMFALPSAAQKTTSLEIATSAQCEMCKDRIEEAMAFERGVKKANLDVETALLKVEYDSRKTSADRIRQAVSKTGYDADDVKADEKAYAKLPACCKKTGDSGHVPHAH